MLTDGKFSPPMDSTETMNRKKIVIIFVNDEPHQLVLKISHLQIVLLFYYIYRNLDLECYITDLLVNNITTLR